jgi:hypothetical protein
MIKEAYISDDGVYRYNLVRDKGDENSQAILFIMLNPSVADAVFDDPTIRRCLGFADRLACDYMEVVNLFAFRATDPKDMKSAEDPVGPDNDTVIREALEDADVVICAWGAHGGYRKRDAVVLDIVREMGHVPNSLGDLTKGGQPRHPLYLKGDTPLMEMQ